MVDNEKYPTKVKIKLTIKPDDVSNTGIDWTIQLGSSFFDLTNDGVVSGKKIGKGVVKATTQEGGFSDTCNVFVQYIPSNLNLPYIFINDFLYGSNDFFKDVEYTFKVSKLNKDLYLGDTKFELETGVGTGVFKEITKLEKIGSIQITKINLQDKTFNLFFTENFGNDSVKLKISYSGTIESEEILLRSLDPLKYFSNISYEGFKVPNNVILTENRKYSTGWTWDNITNLNYLYLNYNTELTNEGTSQIKLTSQNLKINEDKSLLNVNIETNNPSDYGSISLFIVNETQKSKLICTSPLRVIYLDDSKNITSIEIDDPDEDYYSIGDFYDISCIIMPSNYESSLEFTYEIINNVPSLPVFTDMGNYTLKCTNMGKCTIKVTSKAFDKNGNRLTLSENYTVGLNGFVLSELGDVINTEQNNYLQQEDN